jgi:nickel/cobalt transporter (NiCoT) family protein
VALGVFVAGGIGTVEYLQVLSTHAHLSGPFWDWLNGLDFELLGYVIVAAFIAFWIASVVWYKARRIEDRYSVKRPASAAVGGATLALGPGDSG